MRRWEVEFYEDAHGCPVREFLSDLAAPPRAKLLAPIHLLQQTGPTLPFPYSSQLRGKLRELRTSYGGYQYRVLYFGAPSRRFVLLHAIHKKSKQMPERDISMAEARMETYLRGAGASRRSDQ